MTESPPLTSVDAALANAMRLLGEAPELAAEQARQILVAVPGEPGARLVLGMAHNAVARHAEALAELAPLALEQANAARAQR